MGLISGADTASAAGYSSVVPDSKADGMNLASIDLNLLEPLATLLEERSVTRAALKLHRSQPAVSASLARLRAMFKDDLLCRVGNQYELTPFAEQLKPRCLSALASLDHVFDSRASFDPATSTRAFHLATSDYCCALVGRHAAALLSESANGASLRFEPMSQEYIENAPEALRYLDGVVMPHGFIADAPHIELFEDRWICLTSADNDVVGELLTMEDLAIMPWVVSYGTQTAFTPAVRQLQLLGIEPRVQVVVDGFLSLPAFIVGTKRVGLVQHRLLPWLPFADSLRVSPCPFDAVPVRESLWWHPMYDDDPEHRWMRQLMTAAGRRVADDADRSDASAAACIPGVAVS